LQHLLLLLGLFLDPLKLLSKLLLLLRSLVLPCLGLIVTEFQLVSLSLNGIKLGNQCLDLTLLLFFELVNIKLLLLGLNVLLLLRALLILLLLRRLLLLGLLSGLGLAAERFVHVREGVLLSEGLAL
jgi:hypothetical protein